MKTDILTAPSHFELHFDHDYKHHGTKMTRDGYYRFTLRAVDEQGERLFDVRGFRVDKTLTTLLPPTSAGRTTMYQVVEASDRWKASLLDYIRENRRQLGL